jgi:uncharacterized UPF0160 family protein
MSNFNDLNACRTRDPDQLKECDIVVDVGGIFDHETKRYDHHQRFEFERIFNQWIFSTFNETMNSLGVQMTGAHPLNYTTKLSSAGLVYAYYGKEVIRGILERNGDLTVNEDSLEFYYDQLYKEFVESVDAVDNGIKSHDDEAKYVIPVTLQSLVSLCDYIFLNY